MDRQPVFEGELFDGAGSGFAATTRGPIGLSIDRRNRVPMFQQGLEAGYRKFRRPGKYNIQGYAPTWLRATVFPVSCECVAALTGTGN